MTVAAMAETTLDTSNAAASNAAASNADAGNADSGGDFTLLKCTTRHVRLFTARVENDDLVPDPAQLTLDLDPDCEFLWDDQALTTVQTRFRELVDAHAGADLNDNTLRRIGSELEGEIRRLLQAGALRYNPDCRVQNFSMGLPRTPDTL